jgi:hypothetical protein
MCVRTYGNTELGKSGFVNIKQRQDTFIFRVEGTGVLPVRCVTTFLRVL